MCSSCKDFRHNGRLMLTLSSRILNELTRWSSSLSQTGRKYNDYLTGNLLLHSSFQEKIVWVDEFREMSKREVSTNSELHLCFSFIKKSAGRCPGNFLMTLFKWSNRIYWKSTSWRLYVSWKLPCKSPILRISNVSSLQNVLIF